jgi:hypothetical protein
MNSSRNVAKTSSVPMTALAIRAARAPAVASESSEPKLRSLEVNTNATLTAAPHRRASPETALMAGYKRFRHDRHRGPFHLEVNLRLDAFARAHPVLTKLGWLALAAAMRYAAGLILSALAKSQADDEDLD